jgi:hypothetical protein
MVPFVERRYVFTGNGVFVCKTNVGQQERRRLDHELIARRRVTDKDATKLR